MNDEERNSQLAGIAADRAEHARQAKAALDHGDDDEYARRQANVEHCDAEIKRLRNTRQRRGK